MKRSPLKRKTPLRSQPSPVATGPKERQCKCGERYTQYVTTQNQCSKCLVIKVRTASYTPSRTKPSKEAKAAKENDKKHVKRQAVSAFNCWITKVRDVDKPCVSSKRTWSEQWQAGHYVPATTEALRFDEQNVHKQSRADNFFKSGNLSEYRVELIKRIGPEEVDRLEGPQPTMNWTIEELRMIRDEYRQRLRNAGVPIPRTH